MKKSFIFYLGALFFHFFLLGIAPSGFSETWIATDIKRAGEGKVLIEKGRISVDVKDNLLGDVLRQIEAQYYIWIKGNESVLREKVSIQFEDLSLEQGMKRILSRFNSCLMFDRESKLAGVIIIGSQNNPSSSSAPPGLAEVTNELPESLRPTENAPVPKLAAQATDGDLEHLRPNEVPESLRPTENAPAPKLAAQATDGDLEHLRPNEVPESLRP